MTNANVNTAIGADLAATLLVMGLLTPVPLGAATVGAGIVESPTGVFTATSAAVGATIVFALPTNLVAGGFYVLRYRITSYTLGAIGNVYFSLGGARQMVTSSAPGSYVGTHAGYGIYGGDITATPTLRVSTTFTGVIQDVSLVRLF